MTFYLSVNDLVQGGTLELTMTDIPPVASK